MNGRDQFDHWYMGQVRGVLSEWRARYPLVRACPPLRADLHTHTSARAETNRERRQRAEREWMKDLID